MRHFVDFHCHLLPSLDDGAVDQRDSLEMARILADFGFATVHCTPHLIKGSFDNRPEMVTEATGSLQRLLDDAGIPLRLIAGTEHYLDEFLPQMIPGALTAGSSRYLLVEVPFRSGGEIIPGMVAELGRYGMVPLFAHPERCQAFQAPVRDEGMRGVLSYVLGRRKEPDPVGGLISQLQASGCRFQGNIGSFAGVYGGLVKQRALSFLKQGVYSCLGSDAHTPQGLKSILFSGFEVVVAAVGETLATDLLKTQL